MQSDIWANMDYVTLNDWHYICQYEGCYNTLDSKSKQQRQTINAVIPVPIIHLAVYNVHV